MKTIMKRTFSAILALIISLSCIISAFAGTSPFAQDAYATVITASDFQNNGAVAYDRFAKILGNAKNDGMPTPDSLLVGGDYTLILFDNAVPGIGRIRSRVLNAYPDFKPESAVFIQGNHDNPKAEFTDTGFYDMGAYCLYVINEDNFPWQQSKSNTKKKAVEKTAADIDAKLTAKSAAGDERPVFVITHVPLHHTDRNGYGDNKYASYIFNVLNKWAETMDIVFFFGHNHSGDYDDYIGGSVNFMAPGEKIRIPLDSEIGENCYTEETLKFTYTNCGYVGTSKNAVSETSTNIFTMGVVQFTPTTMKFIRYGEEGFYASHDVARKNVSSTVKDAVYPDMECSCLCHSENMFGQMLWKIWSFFLKLFGSEPVCACGKVHF